MEHQKFATLMPAASFNRAPWKNGGGITSEVAIYPSDAKLEAGNFHWRLSCAEVGLAGPFSEFPGFERLLAVVSGKEIVLRNAEQLTALQAGEVFRFSGSESFHAELPHGPVKDIGVIFHPTKVKADMRVLEFNKRPRSFQLASATNFFYVMQGEFSAEVYPGDQEFPLQKGDVLRLNPLLPSDRSERLILLQPNSKEGRVVAVEIISLDENN